MHKACKISSISLALKRYIHHHICQNSNLQTVLSFFFINCIIKYCCLFCWWPAVMASSLPVAFRILFTCLFIFMFGFCAKNKFFFFFFFCWLKCLSLPTLPGCQERRAIIQMATVIIALNSASCWGRIAWTNLQDSTKLFLSIFHRRNIKYLQTIIKL